MDSLWPCTLSQKIFRCDQEIQKTILSLTFEDLITSQNGVTASRALVNVVIDQQIGQQIGVRPFADSLALPKT